MGRIVGMLKTCEYMLVGCQQLQRVVVVGRKGEDVQAFALKLSSRTGRRKLQRLARNDSKPLFVDAAGSATVYHGAWLSDCASC